MAKILRYRTRAGWTTKEAFPAEENRLLATEVDDNFLALEDQYAASTGAGIVGFKQAGTGAIDRTVEYVSRMKRPEWSAIGLVGKLRIKKGSIVNPNLIKMRDITETIEEWLVK